VRFSVLVVTRGRPELLRETLESVLACDPPPHEVIVVDGDGNRSADRVVAGLQGGGCSPEVRYLPSEPGLSVQRNRGVEIASGDVVVFLDDDVALDPGLFGALADAYRDPAVAGATGRVVEADRRRFGGRASPLRRLLFPGGPQGTMTRFGYPRRILDPEREHDVEWMQGCFMSTRTGLARHVPHDELISAEFEGEDEDFSYRLSRLGRVRYVPRAVLHHKQVGFRSSRRREREFNRDIVLARTYLFRKNFRPTLVTRIQFAGLIGILVIHRAINREWAGVLGVLEGAALAWRARDARGLLARPRGQS
jgi:GT2 family glycosyltransferase